MFSYCIYFFSVCGECRAVIDGHFAESLGFIYWRLEVKMAESGLAPLALKPPDSVSEASEMYSSVRHC